jgi:hypothetical protein
MKWLFHASAAAEPISSPSHSCGEQLYTLGGAPVQDGAFQGVAFSFGRTNLEDSRLTDRKKASLSTVKRQRLAIVKFR